MFEMFSRLAISLAVCIFAKKERSLTVFDWLRATVMVRPREFLVCPLSSPYLTNMNASLAGISVGEEMNFTFDIRLFLTG
jgi:hypothetical protein